MTLLAQYYASAPTKHVQVNTLDIYSSAFPPIRICDQYEDIAATVETGAAFTFEASAFAFSLPRKDDSATQTLNFAIQNVTGRAQRNITQAINDGADINVIYRTYLYPDLSAPAEPPIRLTVIGAEFENTTAQFQAAHMDIISYAWPRDRYNIEDHRGLKYIG